MPSLSSNRAKSRPAIERSTNGSSQPLTAKADSVDNVTRVYNELHTLIVSGVGAAAGVLLFARVMGKKYAGSPLAKYFITSDSFEDVPTPAST